MANTGGTKLRILALHKILQEQTDAEHGLTMSGIIDKLAEYGITAERKSIYDDIAALREFDVDVQTYKRSPVEYAIERRGFSLDELMLMIDAIASCRAITDQQVKMLTINIRQLASTHEQELLDRRIHVEGRIKSKNESVFPTVDTIYDAVRLRCKLEFSYRKIGQDGKLHDTHEGKKHVVTPVRVSYDDGFYYLAAWNESHQSIAQYRLDRMARVRVLEGEPATRNKQISEYRDDQSKKPVMFGRFAGEEVAVTLAVDSDKVEIITDRFGDAATFGKASGAEVCARVHVCKSEQFFGWVASMGGHVRIAKPASLVEEYKNYLRFLLEGAQGAS